MDAHAKDGHEQKAILPVITRDYASSVRRGGWAVVSADAAIALRRARMQAAGCVLGHVVAGRLVRVRLRVQ